jgi:hypothetical protein
MAPSHGDAVPAGFTIAETGRLVEKLSSIYRMPHSLEVSCSTEFSTNAGKTWVKSGNSNLKWDLNGNQYHYIADAGDTCREFVLKDGGWTVFFHDKAEGGKRKLTSVSKCRELEVPFDAQKFFYLRTHTGGLVDFQNGTLSKIPGGICFSTKSQCKLYKTIYEDMYVFSEDLKFLRKEVFVIGTDGSRVEKEREYSVPEGMLMNVNGFLYPSQIVSKNFDEKGKETIRSRTTFAKNIKINEEFEKSAFVAKIPVGTRVLNTFENRIYIQTADGTPDAKSDLAKRIDDFIEKMEKKPAP